MSAANESAQKLLVSIIIPTFNRAAYIVDAIKSVLAQDVPQIEIIVVDDGSRDNTREVLEPYMGSIRYIRQANKGVSAARNTGVRAARGKFIAFLDSDDLWKPGKLKAQVALQPADNILCFHGVEWFVDNERDRRLLDRAKKVSWPRCDAEGYVIDPILDVADGRYLQLGTLMSSKRAFLDVGFFDESLTLGEDEDWLSRASMQKRFFYLPQNVLSIRLHGHQTALESEANLRSLITVFTNIKARTQKAHNLASSIASQRLAAKWSHLANIFARDGRRGDAFRAALHAYRAYPRNLSRLIKAVLIMTLQRA